MKNRIPLSRKLEDVQFKENRYKLIDAIDQFQETQRIDDFKDIYL